MPDEWAALLDSSGITQQERAKNPENGVFSFCYLLGFFNSIEYVHEVALLLS